MMNNLNLHQFNENMFKNLLSELTKNNMKISNIASLLDISEQTLKLKLSGKKEFDIVECLKIQNVIGDGNICLEYLFRKI